MKHLFTKKSLIAVGAFALVTLGLASAASAVSLHSTWFASRHNTVGSSFINMSPSATTFCYLSGVETTETDTGSETARCQVRRGQVVWTLQAILGTSSDADIECEAICYTL